jgi:hypothetical protein
VKFRLLFVHRIFFPISLVKTRREAEQAMSMGYKVGQKWKSSIFPILMWVAGVTICHQSNNLLMYLTQNDFLAWLVTAKIALDRET